MLSKQYHLKQLIPLFKASHSVVWLIDGKPSALNTPYAGSSVDEVAKLAFDLADQARLTMDIQLGEAKAGEETVKTAGRA